ncbi:MAG: hypothetical protein WBW31_19110, partial [Candidatus Sulfotelmatobacter sp.]
DKVESRETEFSKQPLKYPLSESDFNTVKGMFLEHKRADLPNSIIETEQVKVGRLLILTNEQGVPLQSPENDNGLVHVEAGEDVNRIYPVYAGGEIMEAAAAGK